MGVLRDPKSTLAPIICALAPPLAPIFAPWRHPPPLYPTLLPNIFLSFVSLHASRYLIDGTPIAIPSLTYLLTYPLTYLLTYALIYALAYYCISVSLSSLWVSQLPECAVPLGVSSVVGTPCNDVSWPNRAGCGEWEQQSDGSRPNPPKWGIIISYSGSSYGK